MKGWTCPHGIGQPLRRGDCESCNADLEGRADPRDMTGDARAEEVRALLNDANAYRVGDIHKRLQALVGRSVWTHEFVTDLALAEEARTWEHPVDLADHVVRTARAVTDAPLIVVETDR